MLFCTKMLCQFRRLLSQIGYILGKHISAVSIQNPVTESPLSLEELELIDSTALPNLERHHLRLLAHCLNCFKRMSNGALKGPFPTHQERLQRCLRQPSLQEEIPFIYTLLDQLASASSQLEELATQVDLTPLELTLDDLIQASLQARATE